MENTEHFSIVDFYDLKAVEISNTFKEKKLIENNIQEAKNEFADAIKNTSLNSIREQQIGLGNPISKKETKGFMSRLRGLFQ
jgi:hypothetical protein